jgi:hypothetical protein
MPSWWPFGKGSDGDAGVSAPELQQADVEKIASVRFVRDFRDGENRVIGLEYLLRWKDGAPDSWCVFVSLPFLCLSGRHCACALHRSEGASVFYRL